MALTLENIRDLVKENCHNDTSITDARYDNWINLAQDDLERRFLGRWVSTEGNVLTVADQREYTLVISNFRSFIQFWQEDTPIKLAYLPFEDFVRLEPDPEDGQSGKPRWWTFMRFTSGFPTVLFYPTPDAAYTIKFEYAKNLGDLSSNSDVSLISQLGWPSILVNGATKRYYEIHSVQDASMWNQLYEKDIREFKQEFVTQIKTRSVMVDIMRDQELRPSSLFRLPENFPAQ